MDLTDYRLIADTHYKAKSGTARQLRKNAGLSIAEIASRIGVSESAVSRWETGNRLPRGQVALQWAELLKQMEQVTSSVETAA